MTTCQTRGESMDEHMQAIQGALQQAGVDGWLFADFRGSDPLAYRVLKLSNAGMLSRRWYYYLPATGEPRKLVHRFEAVWIPEQWESHQYAARTLRSIIDEAFGHIRDTVTNRGEVSEHAVQQFILGRFDHYGMRSDKPPIVAVNAHSADPHFQPTPTSGAMHRGDFVLLDIWSKRKEPRSVYADITWTGYVGETVPEAYRNIFLVVQHARDAAIEFVQDAVHAGRALCGWEVDDVAREAIRKAGYGEHFIHRTGHSIGEEVHGNGANIDNYESRDERHILPHTCFSIEPGVYLPGQFGVRSEVDMYVSDHAAWVTGQPIQLGVVPILKT